ncbi:PIG-L deacetylase family protein [Conexibacter arvalis]|uniref:LmbE family N-acetylglucosaminyl deacetylase n=1 Tax=Conexibacter arvalis TaxID=912552 RepID=A0A840I7M0_9ACTN|nr:PIG-L family deacetylase [Conexibacter arvalis]MBB4660857.1 LmbE family N-acetylglucosaminyl deacetylase [Conexibacter arvalis]
MRVLAVAAHPDDLELLCGGTLARLAAEGHAVTMCNVCAGDRGSFVHSSEEIRAIRLQEARRAAEIGGAAHVSLGIPDGEADGSDPEQRWLVIDLIRRTRPQLVLTHAEGDYMRDHNEVSRLVVDASFTATLPLLETDAPHHDEVAAVYHFDTVAGVGFSPTEYVDVSDHIETKLAMLGAHDSQLSWLREHDGVDIVEQARIASAYRGFQSGVAYAEGFAPCRTWLRNRTVRLLP